jgi:hypothetical protein
VIARGTASLARNRASFRARWLRDDWTSWFDSTVVACMEETKKRSQSARPRERDGPRGFIVQPRHSRFGRWLRFACSCPVGVEGEFCKHCIAVALRSLADGDSSAPTLDDARAYLEGLPPRSLVELLVDHAHDDERLARRLLLLTARSRERSPGDMDSLRVLIDQAFAFHEFVPYREVWGYMQGIEETIDALDEMLTEGHAGEVIELTEYALTAVEHSLEHVDDSDGQMGDLAARLQELHLEACRRGAPDPVELAERLFARELEGGWDIFYRAAMTYADISGRSAWRATAS